jgi:hypothetical protein
MKNVRLILTAMSMLLLLGGTIASSTFAADPGGKTPQPPAVSQTPRPASPSDNNSKGPGVSPTPASPRNGTPPGPVMSPTSQPTSSGEGPAATATPKPTSSGEGPAATATPKPTSSRNEESNENNDNDDENNEPTPAPVVPPLSYSFIPNTTSSMYVDGFGPVAVMSVLLSTGQSVTIPILPYSTNMVWGSFGTYANWAAQFQAQNGRAPTDQDTVDFWISQALAGQLRISPTP